VSLIASLPSAARPQVHHRACRTALPQPAPAPSGSGSFPSSFRTAFSIRTENVRRPSASSKGADTSSACTASATTARSIQYVTGLVLLWSRRQRVAPGGYSQRGLLRALAAGRRWVRRRRAQASTEVGHGNYKRTGQASCAWTRAGDVLVVESQQRLCSWCLRPLYWWSRQAGIRASRPPSRGATRTSKGTKG
jgi:hypothetical protein